MVELRGTLILFLATSLLAITASAYANPLAAYGDATERDVAVAIPGDGIVVPLSETAGIRFADGGVEAQWGRLYVRTYPTVTFPDGGSFEREATFTAAPDLAGNAVTYTGDESRMTYEVYESLLKETIVLNRPGNVSYRYDIGLTDWTTEETVFDETGAEVGTTPHVEPASNSTWSIDLDRWGNVIISINGAETVVLPRPFATDADGVRYDLDYVLNTEAKTITIAGIPDSVRYPLTIDPTERVVNGGFETGDFSGWQTGGSGYSYSHSIRSSDAGRLPHSGSFFARVRVRINGDAQNGDSSSAHIQQTFDMSDVPSITFFGSGRADPPAQTVASAATYIGSSQYGFPHRQYHSPDRWDLVTISPVPGGNNQLRFRVWDSTTFWSVSGSNYIYIDDVSALVVAPTADFTCNPSSGAAPLTVQFTDTSTGDVTARSWDFGDTGTSTDQHPTHIYSSAGTYTVTLNVSNACGYDISSQTLITVTSDQTVMNPAPSFELPNTLILREGKNFVSTPCYLTSGHDTAGTVFPDFGTGVRGYRFENGRTVILTAQDEILPLEGYIIYSDGYHEIPLLFEDPQPGPMPLKNLDEGWNLVGFYGLSQESARDTLISLRNAWSEAKGWDAGSQEYETSFIRDSTGDTSDQRLMYPGKAYRVYMTEEGTLVPLKATKDNHDEDYPQVGVEWVTEYDSSSPLPLSDDNAIGFYNTLGNAGWVQMFEYGNNETDGSHFTAATEDWQYIDGVDTAYYSGHASYHWLDLGPGLFNVVPYTLCEWGDHDLEWIFLHGCHTTALSEDFKSLPHWAMNGVHLVCGYVTVAWDTDDGVTLATYLLEGETVKEAWFRAIDETHDANFTLKVIGENEACGSDHIWGSGSVVLDQPVDAAYYEWIYNCRND